MVAVSLKKKRRYNIKDRIQKTPKHSDKSEATGQAEGRSQMEFTSRPKRIRKIDEIESCYYIRFMAIDNPGVLAKISGILGKYKISIASVIQKTRRKVRAVPIIILIHRTKERSLRKALAEINRLSVIKASPVAIKIEQERQL